MSNAPAILANVLVLSTLVWFGFLHEVDPDAYYLSVQEDTPLEWATFAAFLIAGLLHGYEATQRRDHLLSALFIAGLGLFCLVFAGEEVSWFQRVAGYQSPEYFLANNYQQEFNFHNVISTEMRKVVMQAIMIGYGVLLPLLMLNPTPRNELKRLGIVAPPVELVPTFVVTFAFYSAYPWSYTGEISEMMLGLTFMFASVLRILSKSEDLPVFERRWTRPVFVADAWTAAVVIGIGASGMMAGPESATPSSRQAAITEVEALERDVRDLIAHRNRPAWSKKSIHQRLFTIAEEEDVDALRKGAFFDAATTMGDDDRARFFLDPWNSPYWARFDKRSEGLVITLYSFGPNRRRDSTRSQLRGDDIGTVIRLRRKGDRTRRRAQS